MLGYLIRQLGTGAARTAGRAAIIGVAVALIGTGTGQLIGTGTSQLIGTGTGAVGAAPVAVASGCEVSDRSDLDGDDQSDIVVGMPAYDDGAGAVDVRGTRSEPLLLRAGDLGGTTAAGYRFGSALALGDLDGDRCVDLIIGAPGESTDAAADGGRGRVYVVFGSPRGLDPAGAFRLPSSSSTTGEFGRTLALVNLRKGTHPEYDLFVGAPGAIVDGVSQAGEVRRYRLTGGGDGRVTSTLMDVRSQNSAGVPGTAETGDRFGEVLSPLASGGVLVGVPKEDLGPARDAGALWSMPTDAAGDWTGAQWWSQDSPGVPGKAETGDRFGAAVGDRGPGIVVGVPGEDLGSLRNAGQAQVFTQSAVDGGLVPGRMITQDSPGIPGRAEAGDRFGSAIAVGSSLDGPGSGTVDAAIGVPGDDVGSVRDAGTILLVPVSGENPRAAMSLRQGQRLSGNPEPGDAVGSVLTVTRGGLYSDEDYSDRLLVGVPAEDLPARADAGLVEWPLWGTGRRPPLNLTFSGGYRTTRNYGQVLPSSAD